MVHRNHIHTATSKLEVIVLLITAARELDIHIDEKAVMVGGKDDVHILYKQFTQHREMDGLLDEACDRCYELNMKNYISTYHPT